jgi:phosphoribosylformylglycinamidine (FGAM) synthase-like amidotransferase family enzyme
MPLSRFGFIVKGPGYCLGEHSAQLESKWFYTSVLGVSEMSEAFEAAKTMLNDKIQMIELCGGFSEADAAEIRRSISNQVPVGVVVHDAESLAEIEKLVSE